MFQCPGKWAFFCDATKEIDITIGDEDVSMPWKVGVFL